MRPQPCAYICGSAPRTSRNGASSITVSIREEDLRRELLDRADALHPRVVDQDVGALGGPFGRVEVGQVQGAGFDAARRAPCWANADQVGQALGVPVDRPHRRPGGRQPQAAGASDAPAAPVTSAVRPSRSRDTGPGVPITVMSAP